MQAFCVRNVLTVKSFRRALVFILIGGAILFGCARPAPRPEEMREPLGNFDPETQSLIARAERVDDLVEELGVRDTEIQQVLLAGSFGSYLSPASAVRIGLVPRLPLPRIVSAGNVAGEGAKMALLSMQERHAATAMLDEIEYVELSDRTDFNDRFVEQLAFPE